MIALCEDAPVIGVPFYVMERVRGVILQRGDGMNFGAETMRGISESFVETFADMAVRETKKNGLFVIPGIGRLVRVDRKARLGRNPATGETIKIPAKKVVKFRVAKAVKDSIVPPKKAAAR